ncbi:hypothetical protein [Janthinobacterium psychrotolerans]|uniref:Protein FliT n=1 Tax=Janthinobacterium psychrotolerans TaxID=1747903 RepID=A0A1A7C825_9BURK|nr:hypothetical protein [Janthinobacterium psychrotolerans]OBV40920.1 hypothetical protein ASR47_102146 [Janthinobacterium psychrotolerans]
MDNSAVLLQFARELQDAAGQQDWAALDVLDRRLARQLALLSVQGGLDANEQATLRTLRAAHARAFQLCSDEKHRLGQQLGDIHSRQEGWVAYALESDMYQDGKQA